MAISTLKSLKQYKQSRCKSLFWLLGIYDWLPCK